jgi:hypothetical protein
MRRSIAPVIVALGLSMGSLGAIHASMFMQFLAAQHAGNEQIANFYAERFPPDVKKAYDGWLAQKPFENPIA